MVDSWVEIQGRKKVKLAEGVQVVTSLQYPVCASPDIVHYDVAMAENKDVHQGRR
jgi:hypothetical protein